jgi:serine/threonine protein kinase
VNSSTSVSSPEAVGERYSLLERIGEGTFAVTYRARDVVLDRIVAVKLLRPQYASDATFLARFSREARAAAQVNHPNVVHVYDYGARDDTPYLVLQYVPGRDLKESLAREGPYPPEEAIRITSQTLHGLEAIHRVGLIHRDVKPQNILLGFDQTAHVADFGIAHNPANSLLTGDGTTLGTPSYMAPEQARGEPVTKAADLYAAGVVLFELLTGRLPFTGDTPLAVMRAHVEDPPPWPSAFAPNPIPPALDAIVLRALAKDPKDRYLSAADMAHALEQIDVGTPDEDIDRIVVPPFMPSGAYTPFADSPTIVAPAALIDATETAPPPRPVPNSGRTRWGLAWFAPLSVLAVALAILGGVMAMGGGKDDGGNFDHLAAQTTPTDSANLGAAGTATRIPLIAARPTDTPAPTSMPTKPPTATSTSTPAPAMILTVGSTDTPAPTNTPRPTPTPKPTRTPRPPTPTPSSNEPPTIAPANGSRPTAATDAKASSQPLSLSFDPGQWQGGYYRGDNGFLGRPWVAVYGAQSGMGQVTLTFTLDTTPSGGVTLTITGINDEWASPNPMTVEVNGVAIYDGPCPFPAWDGAGNGENAVWGTSSWTIPTGTLRKGTNTITVTNHTQSANTNSPPYVDLSTTTLESR